MKDLLDKISSYNLFNYLLPGILFSFLSSHFKFIDLIQKDLVTGVFLYYFIGLIISRVGSLIIEPILKKSSFLIFADYKDFVKASKSDEKIEILSESNNMYRTFISMSFLLIVLKLYLWLSSKFIFLDTYGSAILIVLLMVLFLFSYKKQTAYITNRIKSILS